MKLLKSLLKKYPDHGFWLTINPPQTIGSFAYFKTKEGKQFVEVAHRFYKTSLNPEQKEVILGDKIGKKINIIRSIHEELGTSKTRNKFNLDMVFKSEKFLTLSDI